MQQPENHQGDPPVGGQESVRPGALDHGFNILAKDLDRAFALGLSPNQAVIMNSIREQSWTAAAVTRKRGEPRPDPIPAKVNLSHLAEATGFNRSRLSTGLKGLFNGLILAKSEGGVLVRKDYAKWLDDEGKSPRFTPSQLAYIRAAKKKNRPSGAVAKRNSEVLQNATSDTCRTPLKVLQNATVDSGAVAKRNTNCCKMQQLHIEERAPGDSLDFKDSLYTYPGEGNGEVASQPQRSEADARLVNEASALLAGDLRTEHVAMELGREHNLPGLIEIAGWQWLAAAKKLVGPGIPESARRSFKYLAKVAGNETKPEAAPVEAPEDREARRASATARFAAHRAELARREGRDGSR
jgi:hypothetical protein